MYTLLTDVDADELDLQVARYKPESLENLCKNTKFSKKELQIMYRGFKQVSAVLARERRGMWPFHPLVYVMKPRASMHAKMPRWEPDIVLGSMAPFENICEGFLWFSNVINSAVEIYSCFILLTYTVWVLDGSKGATIGATKSLC